VKFLPSQLIYFLQGATTKRNAQKLGKFMGILLLMVVVYSTIFHYIMEFEGRDYSWVTGFYWTLTVMTTLGFGDITFTGDLGRAFSILVMLSGVVFLLVMLPFTFIQFFYAPWLAAQAKARAPREIPEGTAGHVILTGLDPVAMAVAQRLRQIRWPHLFIVADLQRALELYDQGLPVMLGQLDDPETYRRARAEAAVLAVVTNDDLLSTNITFTIHEHSERVPVMTNADAVDSVDILQLAGSSHVCQFAQDLGRSLARRVLVPGMRANVIGRFDQLLIAEAAASGTPLAGKTLAESRLREATGVTVVGLMERGRFEIPQPETRIGPASVLVMAGTEAQLERLDETMGGREAQEPSRPVLILGGGRVGRAAADLLTERRIDYRIIEKNSRLAGHEAKVVVGSAADLETLNRAGIREAGAAIVTTHNDDLNIYLTIYCRRLRADMQIISRSTLDRNVSTLHRAGADFVLSYASLGASTVLNLLRPSRELLLEEGLSVFRLGMTPALAGQLLRDSRIREETGCSVVAIRRAGALHINPAPAFRFGPTDELILIGTDEAEARFIARFPGAV